MNTVQWLFERSAWKPQIGLADTNKKAVLWLPGNTKPKRITEGIIKYYGATQLAFEFHDRLQQDQPCEIVWLGLDIDEQPGLSDDRLLAVLPPECSLRASCGGIGRHVLIRLATPVRCNSVRAAGKIVKQLAGGYAQMVEDAGIEVCKADRRMFWLEGGANAWIKQTEELATPEYTEVVVGCQPEPEPDRLEGFHPEIQTWLKRFGVKQVNERNPVYIGHIVEVLRQHGETVNTKSPMSGNGHTNGYLDISHDFIGLWAYADSRYIWRLSLEF